MLATELLLMNREPERWSLWLGAERLMGMLLVIVAVEMLMPGLAEYPAR